MCQSLEEYNAVYIVSIYTHIHSSHIVNRIWNLTRIQYVKALNISSVWTDPPPFYRAEINVTTTRAAASLHVFNVTVCRLPSKMRVGLGWHKDSGEQFSAALRCGDKEIVLYFSSQSRQQQCLSSISATKGRHDHKCYQTIYLSRQSDCTSAHHVIQVDTLIISQFPHVV